MTVALEAIGAWVLWLLVSEGRRGYLDQAGVEARRREREVRR